MGVVMSLYEAIGGAAAIDAAVDRFYDKVLGDPLLAPFFASMDMESQRRKQKAFFGTVFKGQTEGVQSYMRTAHKRLVDEGRIGDAHFDAVAGHLQSTLEDLTVPADLIVQVMGAAAGLRNAVLGR